MRRLLCSLVGTTVLFATGTAAAAGLYFSDRGVRPIGRGGAFVAGADDLGAIWYNPAGIADAGNSFLLDASWLRFSSSFQRRSQVRNPDTGETRVVGEDYFPEVKGTSPLLPLPTIVIANNFGLKDWNFAIGALGPYSALTSYPEQQLNFGGGKVPAPQRYSLITLDGSALVVLAAQVAFRPSKSFAAGIGVQMLTGTFASRLAFNACPPDRFLCASEQPDWDALAQVTVGPIFAPSGNAGIIATFVDSEDVELRFGASLQLPFSISAKAKTEIRLPDAAVFRNAKVEGDEAEVSFKLPMIARLGLETRLGKARATRLEISLFYEGWSIHDRISITPAGSGIQLRNVTGFPDPYNVKELNQARGFRDAFSLHAGLEHKVDVSGYTLMLRGGLSYERSAVPPAYLSVLTVDMDKVQFALGGSIYVGAKKNLRLDAVFAQTFAFTTTVDPNEAAIEKVKVVRANDPTAEDRTKINGGTYSATAQVIGVGMNWSY